MSSHSKFLRRARQLKESGARFVALVVAQAQEELDVTYLFEQEGVLEEVHVASEGRSLPSLYSVFGLADFPERDASRQHGLKFVGNPNLGEGV